MKKTDAELIGEAKLGSQRAFTMLYNKYHRSIYNIIYNIVKNTDVADDLLSETFTKAFLNINKFTRDISFEMWLKTIANNHSIDFIRGGQKRKDDISMDNELLDEFIHTDFSNPEKELIKKESFELLEQGINELSPRAREVLSLRYTKGHSYQQIADILGMSIGTVKSYISKATNKLKQTQKK
jgi:RNA polymerase sigma-70 factor (ECF subfamily)